MNENSLRQECFIFYYDISIGYVLAKADILLYTYHMTSSIEQAICLEIPNVAMATGPIYMLAYIERTRM